MSTLLELRNQVKASYRISTSDSSMDSYIDQRLNENYKRAAMRPPYWLQLVHQGATFATTAGTEQYATSSDFNRLVPNSVLYFPNGSTNGFPINDLGYQEAQFYRALVEGLSPQIAYVAGGVGTGKTINLMPPFTDTSGTVQYDYYKYPATMATTSTPEVTELEQVIVYETLVNVASYHNDYERAKFYQGQANDFWKSGRQTIEAQ